MLSSLSGATRLNVIVGDPIAQVRAPGGVTAAMQAAGHDGIVVPVQVSPEDLPAFLIAAKTLKNLDGIVITVPHKFACYDFVDLVGPRALFTRSLNIMRRTEDGLWAGENFDGAGFVGGIRKAGCDPRGKVALLVGAGGAGSAIALELLDQGVASLAIHDGMTDRRDSLVARLSQRFPGRVSVGSDDPAGFSLVVNATPTGMQAGDPLPVKAENISPDAFVGDVITKPPVTPLLEAARALGCGTQTGGGMFEAQVEILAGYLIRPDLTGYVPRLATAA